MTRSLRKYHRVAWLVLVIALPVGFLLAFVAARRLEKHYRQHLPALSGKTSHLAAPPPVILHRYP